MEEVVLEPSILIPEYDEGDFAEEGARKHTIPESKSKYEVAIIKTVWL